jgi:hypothetical protein
VTGRLRGLSARRRLLGVAVVGVAIMALAAAVAVGVYLPGRTQTTTGVVVRVNADSLTQVRSFELRTANGDVVTFQVGNLDLAPPGFNAQHLSVHAATAEPVAVTYEDRGGRHVATRLTDAD